MFTRKPPPAIAAICIGHSHAANLQDAAQEDGVAIEVLNFWGLPGAVIDDADGVRLAPYVAARLSAPGVGTPVFSLVGGAVHYDIGLLVPEPAFDVIDPARPDAPLLEGATIIPHGALRHAVARRTAPYLRIMDAVRAAATGPVFHLQSPPVYEDEAVQEHDYGWVAFYGTGRRIAPAWFRQRLWRMHSDVVAAHCAANGITFVPCPPAAMTPEGYLRPGLNGRPAHANAAYGRLLLEQIRGLSRPRTA